MTCRRKTCLWNLIRNFSMMRYTIGISKMCNGAFIDDIQCFFQQADIHKSFLLFSAGLGLYPRSLINLAVGTFLFSYSVYDINKMQAAVPLFLSILVIRFVYSHSRVLM